MIDMTGTYLRFVWIIVLLLLLNLQSGAQYSNFKFENYSTLQGLSSSTCTNIFQDKDGFLWFGTIDGLNRFDGYEFTVYRPIINDIHSISSNRITAIEEDVNGKLWIGTSNGLNIMDKASGKFTRIDLDNVSNLPVGANDVINDLLFDDGKNILWVASKNGLSRIQIDSVNQLNKSFGVTNYVHHKNDSSTLDNNNVVGVIKDCHQNIWVATAGKYLNLYNPVEDNFNRVLIDVPGNFELDHIPKLILNDKDDDCWIGNDLSRLVFWDRKKGVFKKISFSGFSIPLFHIYQDSKGIIWLTTDGYGIYLLDKSKGIIKHLEHNPEDPLSLPNNQTSRVIEDKNGIFWIATYNEGVCKLDMSKSSFHHYYYQPGNRKGLSAKIAQAVMVDKMERIWIGTDGGGLNLFYEETNSFEHFRADQKNPFSICSDKILYLTKSFDGGIWVCTYDGGISKFDPKSKKAVNYRNNPDDSLSLGQNSVWCAIEDNQHRLWLGTQTAGLNLFNPVTGEFTKYLNQPGDTDGLISNFVFSLSIDSKNRLFVGTSLGLYVVYLDQLTGFIPDKIDFCNIEPGIFQSVRINFIKEDAAGNIWIGTDLGLYKLDNTLKVQNIYTTKEGLLNNIVLGIEEDINGHIWITTKSGLSQLNPQTHFFKNYNIHDGIQGTEFQSKSIDKAPNGRILVGGINGFNIFNPSDISMGTAFVFPHIVEFKMFNKTINKGDTINSRVLLNTSIDKVQKLELKHNEGYISFKFLALYYQNPERVQYAYRMKGLDRGFVYSRNSRTANYSNLPPGDYTFEVKASVDGLWEMSGLSAIEIKVLPPLWKTWWAYTFYILFLSAVFFLGMRYYTKIVREEKEHELDQMKLRFFINVSHEFRTPLTLILNPIEKILKLTGQDEVRESALTVQRSAQRLLSLINQLLNFRRMDLGKTPLELVKGDIVKFSKDIFVLFKGFAGTKGIDIQFKSNTGPQTVFFDPDKVEKIINNLLSNAIKYTNTGGSVVLSVSETTLTRKYRRAVFFRSQKQVNYIEICVEDTGIGFKKEQLKDVFGRFFHVDNTKTGTGIGLNFTKGLIGLHGGDIIVESKYGKGSRFIVHLPVILKGPLSASVNKNELVGYQFDTNSLKSMEYEIVISDSLAVPETEGPDNGQGSKNELVLIVEDNRELRAHLKNELKKYYRVKEAIHGADGMEKVGKYFPDIIISDVMMPEMDGFELCRWVKTGPETCHIPVILLTARGQDEDRIEGFHTGADEYIPKPFNMKVLEARISNLLEARRRLREKFSSLDTGLVSSEVTTNSFDEAFLDRATKFIIDNIHNPKFTIEDLLTGIGVSRSHFFRKINALTGNNPSNFIRTIRLKYASGLLRQGKLSIKEIAYNCGFNSTAYFSKTFRELFGQTPSEYIDRQNKGGD